MKRVREIGSVEVSIQLKREYVLEREEEVEGESVAVTQVQGGSVELWHENKPRDQWLVLWWCHNVEEADVLDTFGTLEAAISRYLAEIFMREIGQQSGPVAGLEMGSEVVGLSG